MPYASLLAASALASLALALPQGAYVIHESVAKAGLAPQVHLANAYAKYGATPPEDVATAAANAAAGAVTATPEMYDQEYLCPVTLGGQTLNLDFDTGSADLWVFSTELSSAQSSGHTLYNPSRSPTAMLKNGYSWQIMYGDGSSAAGNVFADKVVVGPVTVTSQAVEAATTVAQQFVSDTQNDGLLGLAFSTINTVKPQAQNTFFDTAIAQGLPKALFTADLKKGKPGAYGFGFIDTTRYTGSIAYTPVDSSQGFWGFSTTGYSVGSTTYTTTTAGIADTGTTLLLLPQTIVTNYYSQVSGARYNNQQGGYVFPCSATLPSFSVVIGGKTFTVPGSYINYAPISSTMCYGGLQSSAGIGINIFGDIFLKAIFAIFDKSQGAPRLGFAAKAT